MAYGSLPGITVFVLMLCVSVCTVTISVWFLQPFGSSEHCLVASIGESAVFSSLHVVLMITGMFTAIFTSFAVLCTSVCVLNLSVRSPMLFGLSECCSAASIGEFRLCKPFQGLLMISGMLAGVNTSV